MRNFFMSAEIPSEFPSQSGEKGAVSLDQLIGLCDEMSALVRCGIPLEESLQFTSSAKRSRIKGKMEQLAREVGTGTPLLEALKKQTGFPPVYSAVIEAGIASGNLGLALDAISENARTLREARVFLARACLYPMFLFTVLWVIFCMIFFVLAPKYVSFFSDFRAATPFLGVMRWSGEHSEISLGIAFGVPIVFWTLYYGWFHFTSRGSLIQSSNRRVFLGWIPWIGRAGALMQKVSFAKICAMLLRSSLPLDSSIQLAARATNDRFWSQKSRDQLQKLLVKKSDAGENGNEKIPYSEISPMIFWAIHIPNQDALVEGFERSAKIFRDRANALIEKCELVLPVIFTFVLACMIAGCYLFCIIIPYIHLIDQLSGIFQ